jgi:histidyl-tRNA synthetase
MPQQGRHLDLPRGMHDVHPEQAEVHNRLRHDWFTACSLAGYQPVEVPPVGFADTFTTGHNVAGDRTYQFTDRKGRELALVSDSLPAILRLARGRGLPEQRLSHCTQVFRYERRPRRCFHHLGILEVSDGTAPLQQRRVAATRLALTLTGFLCERLCVTLVLFDPGIWRRLLARALGEERANEALNLLRHVPAEHRASAIRSMGADARSVRVAEQLFLNRSMHDQVITGDDALDERIETCRAMSAHLHHRGVNTTIDLAELHASEFHDGPAFLVQPDGEERLLGDGGSYGAFADGFLGFPTAVYSAVVGLERLADLSKPTASATPADVAVLIEPQDAAVMLADDVCTELRQRGIRVWDTLLSGPLRQHLRNVARLHIPYSVIIGARELETSHVVVRGRDGTHIPVQRAEIATWLRNRGTAGSL